MSNKDEALRAKDLAEDLMKKSDFDKARRFALKAQKMDATLESIAHMIMVCDVHCALLEKSGDETDWYKILQVEHNADDNTVKKQYKKLALHLHPDKTKLPGAESAFKTIGEAQRVLLDKDRRKIHDMRRKPFKNPSPAQTTWFNTQPVYQKNVNAARNNFTRPENQQKPQSQPTGFSGGLNFWTSCAFCNMKQECLRGYINKLMYCLSCGKQFIATQIAYQQNKVPTQETEKVAPKKQESSARAKSGNGNRKRKIIVESCGSSSSESSCDLKEVATGGQRRSVRSKQQGSYKENMRDDEKKKKVAESSEESDLGKKSHENNLFSQTLPNGINRKKEKKVKQDRVGSLKDSGDSGSESDSEIFVCADPDFNDFEKLRKESCFKAGQTWAMYDDMDRMPRYYAMVLKVIRKPSFMINLTWLEATPDDEKAKQWVRKELPISVGKFQLCGFENINKTRSFSHLIHCRVRGMKNIISVYPRMGETWALFKNWDISWSPGRACHEYNYEFVEILSEYAEGTAIKVAFLVKVKGFISVFCRISSGDRSDTSHIPPHEFLRFSHRVPSTKLTGKEMNGVPVGSYELDTAALPQKIDKLEEEEEVVSISRQTASSNQVHDHSPPSPEPDCIIIPNCQFHDFSAERLVGKFATGQIWSLNSKEDGLPKCYAKIQKIEWKPVFKLHINHLELESLPKNVTRLRDGKMPVSCGNFTLKEDRAEILTKVTGFSQQIKAQGLMRKNKYNVFPKTGEIWAMYKNWSETIKVTSLKKCVYEVVEVLDDNESHIEVMMLERVDGFNSVFKEKVEGGMDVKRKVPWCELLRFSHYVPAFRLTRERDGALRGYVELDSTALSRNLLRS